MTNIKNEREDISVDPGTHICICVHVCAHTGGKLTNYPKFERTFKTQIGERAILEFEGLGSSYSSDNNFE